eukprot:gene12451-biopygen12893
MVQPAQPVRLARLVAVARSPPGAFQPLPGDAGVAHPLLEAGVLRPRRHDDGRARQLARRRRVVVAPGGALPRRHRARAGGVAGAVVLAVRGVVLLEEGALVREEGAEGVAQECAPVICRGRGRRLSRLTRVSSWPSPPLSLSRLNRLTRVG